MAGRFLKNGALCVVAIVFSALLLEIGLRAGAHLGWIEIDINPLNGFWADIDPDFGVWHRANVSYTHEKSCFSVTYTSNSYGALDKERSRRSPAPRVVVLGDSMMEGLTLGTPQRLSNRLEEMTGIEHLNFATSQTFGPIQYLLAYETLAKKFDHDLVLVGFLPENDFTGGLERLLSLLRSPLDGQGECLRGESTGARHRRGDRENASSLAGDGGLSPARYWVSRWRTLARMSRNSGADWVE